MLRKAPYVTSKDVSPIFLKGSIAKIIIMTLLIVTNESFNAL